MSKKPPTFATSESERASKKVVKVKKLNFFLYFVYFTQVFSQNLNEIEFQTFVEYEIALRNSFFDSVKLFLSNFLNLSSNFLILYKIRPQQSNVM